MSLCTNTMPISLKELKACLKMEIHNAARNLAFNVEASLKNGNVMCKDIGKNDLQVSALHLLRSFADENGKCHGGHNARICLLMQQPLQGYSDQGDATKVDYSGLCCDAQRQMWGPGVL